jgi:hypothetical protein
MTLSTWKSLTNIQIGKYAEFYVKMEITRHNWDVYGAEVDDKGIDFVARAEPSSYYDIQVKSLRWPNSQYVFIPETKFRMRDNSYIFLVLFEENANPYIYAIPALRWKNREQQGMFVYRSYEGLKSKPEYGIQIPQKSRDALTPFLFDGQLRPWLEQPGIVVDAASDGAAPSL